MWQARLAAPHESPEPATGAREYVRLERSDGAHRWVILPAGEFERISNYRLRSVVMGVADEPERATMA